MRGWIAVLVVTLVTCGGTDPVDGYLTELELVTQRLTDESASALPSGSPPTHEGVAGVVQAQRNALTAIEGLEPPDELVAEHLALMTVLGDFVAATEKFVAETASLEPDDFLRSLEASTDIDVLAGRVAEACDAMRVRARVLGHVADLEC